MEPTNWILVCLVAVFVLTAAFTDLSARRIPNWLTVSSLAVALLFHTITGGWAGLGFALGGFATGFSILLVLWLIGGGGGGDVKLMGALGGWMGAKGGVLPNTLICGVTKGGTTTLWSFFREHPQALVARRKEVHFFDYESHYARGLAHYARQFRGYSGQRAIVDATPSYYLLPAVAQRIHQALPLARLIFCFRNPVERTYSNFWMGYASGRPDDSFDEAIRRPENRHLLAGSFYADAVERYLRLFPRDQLLLLLTDELKTDARDVRQRCYAHAGIDADYLPPDTRPQREAQNVARVPRNLALQRRLYRWLAPRPERELSYDAEGRVQQRRDTTEGLLAHAGVRTYYALSALNTRPARYPPMSPEAAAYLLELFRPDIERFGRLTGLDVSGWLAVPRPDEPSRSSALPRNGQD